MEAAEGEEVRAALAELLAWHELQRSPQLGAFLRYIVEARLEGRDESIKAYAIAVDVFGRPESFDPQTDPIVRVQARRLRASLGRFYGEGRAQARIAISIPVGGYLPEFARRESDSASTLDVTEAPQDPTELSARSGRSGRETGGLARQARPLLALMALGVLFWIAIATFMVLPNPFDDTTTPLGAVVYVTEFQNLAFDARGDPVAAGLGPALVDLLDRFAGVDARFTRGPTAELAGAHPANLSVFSVAGVVRRSGTELDYSAVLSDLRSGQRVDDYTFAVSMADGRPQLSLSEVAQRFAARLGNYTGPLHADVRAWLASDEHPGAATDVYPCVVGYALSRRSLETVDAESALACARRAQEGRDGAVALALEAALIARDHWLFGRPTAGIAMSLEDAGRQAEQALSAAPDNALVWELAASVDMIEGDYDAARAHYSSSLQLNPSSLDALAGLALLDALIGNWEPALRRATLIDDVVPDTRDWHVLPFALDALRQRDPGRAVTLMRPLADTLPILGPVVMVAAGAQLGDTEIVGRYLPSLMSAPAFQERGILPVLRRYLRDPGLMAAITGGLSLAGLSLDRLTGPF